MIQILSLVNINFLLLNIFLDVFFLFLIIKSMAFDKAFNSVFKLKNNNNYINQYNIVNK